MNDIDIHSCGYYCDRHACIVVQRNELRDKLFAEPTIHGWPLYSGLPPAKVQDERKTQYKSWAQSAQVIGTPQREWVGLTDETYWEMWVESPSDVLRFAHAIEAKLKEKNG